MIRERTRLLSCLALMLGLVGARAFAADDDVILEENSKPENAETVNNERLVRMGQIQVQRARFAKIRVVPVISDDDFERQIFAQDVTSQRERWRINADLDLAINRIDRTCWLTKVQLQKLAMAGRIDRSRFFDRVEATRKRIRSNEINADELARELEALRKQAESGILGPGSFFAKSVRTVLTPEQLEICQQPHQHALIEKTVSLIEKQARFQPTSREAFVKLLQDEIPDVAVFWADEKYYGSAEIKEMRHRLSLLADVKMKPLLNDSQWNALREFINHVDEAVPQQRLNVRMGRVVIFEEQARP